MVHLVPVLSAGTPGGSARFKVALNDIHHPNGHVHARRGALGGFQPAPHTVSFIYRIKRFCCADCPTAAWSVDGPMWRLREWM
jgi:hypothetical protein